MTVDVDAPAGANTTGEVAGPDACDSGEGKENHRSVHVLDYGAGNIRSLRNAVRKLGFTPLDIESADDVRSASAIIFPGVGAFEAAMVALRERGLFEALREHVLAGKPYFGICIGMQALFDASEEGAAPGETFAGLAVVPGVVARFDDCGGEVAVPAIGWNCIDLKAPAEGTALAPLEGDAGGHVYFVHSYRVQVTEANQEWVLATATYGGQEYVAALCRGPVFATQFHPEKSGQAGLAVLGAWLQAHCGGAAAELDGISPLPKRSRVGVDSDGATGVRLARGMSKRVVAALDVRQNDAGDLVVTKGDQYDVREAGDGMQQGRGAVRNLGKPVALAARYYDGGVDEVAFLNITSFRSGVLADAPMLQVLERASESVFVPLTVGGGIRPYTDEATGTSYSALEVASRYFRAGADKVSLGSDAVAAAEDLRAKGGSPSGETSIEQISRVYGAQAVVVSIDPRRVWLASPADAPEGSTALQMPDKIRGPNGEEWCWYQATIKGGREGRDIDALEVARASEKLGAGEIMLNCIDTDGQKSGFDVTLIAAVVRAVRIPVIASSGAGCAQHFSEVFEQTNVQAALAAGMFHRGECSIAEVKAHLAERGLPVRPLRSASAMDGDTEG